jgi:ADP-heptose:LPS heptosyltransferase
MKLNPKGSVVLPGVMLPDFRVQIALERGSEKNILFRVSGGIGDQVCAEPTLRYALDTFKGCKISVVCENPELFAHLNFYEVFDLKKVRPVYENYLTFNTLAPPQDIVWHFINHMLTNCIDYPSLCAFRSQLPVSYKQVKLCPSDFDHAKVDTETAGLNLLKCVAVHPGKHWQSKTFPKEFWGGVLSHIWQSGFTPIIIGADTDENRSTVDVCTEGCLDLRNGLTLLETAALLSRVKALLTNDSAPLHLASAFPQTKIGFVATCKHPDLITHWRGGQWGHNMKNFSKGGIWEMISPCPNVVEEVTAEFVDQELLESWLPDPKHFADWACRPRNYREI